MSLGPLLIRADATSELGAGHVMRCLALAQAWRDAGGRALFAMAQAPPAIKQRLRAESCEVVYISAQPGSEEDGRETLRLAQEHKADWVAVDGYQFGSDYQRNLKAAGFKVFFVDDYGHSEHYYADVVLNQNVSADEKLYQNREAYTRLLMGTKYCLLRREFTAWREWERDIPKVGRRVLITMGGADPQNVTGRVMQGLGLVQRGDLEATIVVGGSNPHFEALQSAAGHKGIALSRDATNMAELMAKADIAISAAGSTCWELCLLGLPALSIDVADNQKAVARELDRRGCAIHLGNAEDVTVAKIASESEKLLGSQELRLTLSQRSRELVDGCGAQRVASILRGDGGLRLRPAREEDAPMLWEWANDPVVRTASFSPACIPWEDHVAWFAEKLRSKLCLMLIAEDGDTPTGQIRFDSRPDGAFEVDVSIASAKRGQGFASELISLGVQWFLSKKRGARFHAFVRPENRASVRAFERADFKRNGIEQVRGNEAIHLVYEKN
jgi:UDP-2,4-diacetamido-2,4,6-trideoxy-beta-L-altropyranose hydrolase